MEVRTREDWKQQERWTLATMLKSKAVAMRWEAIALALLGQALQAGVKSRPESWSLQPIEVRSEPYCHCLCVCDQSSHLGLAAALGSAVGTLIFCACTFGRAIPKGEPSPSHRRRGHGIITRPDSWTDFGRLLRWWHILAWEVGVVEASAWLLVCAYPRLWYILWRFDM